MADVSITYGDFSLTITTPDITPSPEAAPAVLAGAIDAQTQQVKELLTAALDAFAVAIELDTYITEEVEYSVSEAPTASEPATQELRLRASGPTA